MKRRLVLGIMDTVTGEMLLLPGVEKADQGSDDFELRVAGKPFAHVHSSDRIDVRLPQDVKESLIIQGVVARSPEMHDREGWAVMRLNPLSTLSVTLRVLQAAYKYTSSMI